MIRVRGDKEDNWDIIRILGRFDKNIRGILGIL